MYHNKSAADDGGVLRASERTTVKRQPARGSYAVGQINEILDAAFICHVGITTTDGPVVIPTAFGRVGDRLYLHGSPASRLLRSVSDGVPVCVTVTIVDALVLARSTFHHSLNYRSVVLFGTATEVVDLDERAAALAAFVEHVVPGRTNEARAATAREVRGTLVLSLPIAEASAKVRTGPPVDEPDDLALPVWGGIVPLTTVWGTPEPDGLGVDGVPVPASIA